MKDIIGYCKFCKREFTNKGGLITHEKYCKENLNKLKFLCKFCNKIYFNKGALTCHQNNCIKNPIISSIYQFEKERNKRINKERRFGKEAYLKKLTESELDTLCCGFCNKKGENFESVFQHKIRCNKNPNKIILKFKNPDTKGNSFKEYNRKVNSGKIKHLNQFSKAESLGLPKPVVSKETKEKRKISSLGRTHTKETKEKMSIKRIETILKCNGDGFKHVKDYKVKNIQGNEFNLQGTWEVIVAEYLNQNNILWTKNTYFEYSFLHEDVIRHYLPDFYLPDFDVYIEVKGLAFELDGKMKTRAVLERHKIKLCILFKAEVDKIKKGVLLNFEDLLKTGEDNTQNILNETKDITKENLESYF